MPTYEYQCKKCQNKLEVSQKITAKPLEACPKCQGPLKRLISRGAGFIFKGPGFHATDYRSKEYKEKQKQESKGMDLPCSSSGANAGCKSCSLNKNAH